MRKETLRTRLAGVSRDDFRKDGLSSPGDENTRGVQEGRDGENGERNARNHHFGGAAV